MGLVLLHFILFLCIIQIHAGNIPTEFAQHTALFSTEIYSKIVEDFPNENVIFSPFSIHVALGMAYMGAVGQTAHEIADGLHFHSTDRSEVVSNYANILEEYRNSSTLKIANKIYSSIDVEIKPEFIALARKSFLSEAENIDFTKQSEAAKIVNSWIEEKTNNKIKNILDESSLSGNIKLMLINAIHFKSNWMEKFSEGFTHSAPFWISESESIDLDMMRESEFYTYGEFEELDAKALRLPYDTDDGMSMVILLPNKRTGLAHLNTLLKNINLLDLHKRMSREYVKISIPKFKAESSLRLKNILPKLGMVNMFTDSAEFPNFIESSQSLGITDVLHKAFIKIDENGTEAAAVTVLDFAFDSDFYVPNPKTFHANRPFIFYIKNSAGNIFFMGNYQGK